MRDKPYWNKLKDKHKNLPGFVIGNGPSLKMDDLTKISDCGFISIASNKIYLAFEYTKWRPDYYSVTDPLLWEKIKKSIHPDIKIIHTTEFIDRSGCNTNIITWRQRKNDFSMSLKNFSNDLSVGASFGETVTYTNIQMAVHLGLNPIYIIGCDHYYAGEKNITKAVPIPQSKENNHFVPNYRSEGEIVYAAPIKMMTKAYEIAKYYCDSNNIRIFNATRGGHLDVFERKSLDVILGEHRYT